MLAFLTAVSPIIIFLSLSLAYRTFLSDSTSIDSIYDQLFPLFGVIFCSLLIYTSWKTPFKDKLFAYTYVILGSLFIPFVLLAFLGSAPSLVAASHGVNDVKFLEFFTFGDYMNTPQNVEFISTIKIRPMSVACGNGRIDVIKHLKSQGYKIHEKGEFRPCFTNAAINKKKETSIFLLENFPEELNEDLVLGSIEYYLDKQKNCNSAYSEVAEAAIKAKVVSPEKVHCTK